MLLVKSSVQHENGGGKEGIVGWRDKFMVNLFFIYQFERRSVQCRNFELKIVDIE